MDNAHDPGAKDQVEQRYRRGNFLFQTLIPNAVQEDIRDVQLANLQDAERNHAD